MTVCSKGWLEKLNKLYLSVEEVLKNTLEQQSSMLRLTKVASMVLFSLATANGYAGAFSLYGEANGRNAGDFAAGAAAEAIDASTLFYNPAGLVRLEGQQVVVGGTLVHASSKLSNNASLQVVPPAPEPSTTLSISNQKIASTAGIPALFYANKVNEKLAWGLGVFVPFGLSTDWGETANTRYSATKSSLQIIDVSPAISAKLNNKLSFGAALDVQYASVDLNSVANVAGPPISSTDVIVQNSGTSIGIGAHAGLMLQATDTTRLGINYQSRVSHQFRGDSKSTLALDGSLIASTKVFSNPASMPDQITFSALHQANDKLELMGTAAFIRWNIFQDITLNNVAPSGVSITIHENFKNTWRVVGGAKYQLNQKIALRMGLGYDQTPVNNTDRNLRLPDADRIALAAGGHYQVNKKMAVDFGWTHLFVKNTTINNSQPVGTNTVIVNAGVKNAVDLFGAQFTWQVA